MNKVTCFILCLVLQHLSLQLQSQQTIRTNLLHDGLTRTYSYYLPANFNQSKLYPLVFNLHGYGSNGDQQEFYGDFRKIADTAGFILVHPNGTVFPQTTQQFWNVGLVGNSNVDDVGFIHAIIDTLSKVYSIDPDRIFSTGMSNGGFMSYHLACVSNRFAAIASVTGSMTLLTQALCKNAQPIPVMEIHGDADAVVNYNGTTGVLAIPEVLDFWIQKNGLDKQKLIKTSVPDINKTDGATAELYIYPGTNEVQHYKIINGAHTWPGSPFVIGTTCQDINASLEIWKFFSKYKRSLVSTKHASNFNIELFPNPANDKILISTQSNSNLPMKVELINSVGQSYLSKCLNTSPYELQITNLPPGIYFINFIQGSTKQTRRFIKQ
ncbi:MAG: T9SS type A sorting domain-containing protein [Saprospiraceae bacterium]|nr:T9SS type A sorting domain-containing protein [Saprospiraceae bacterium]MBK7737981.1 T9SS type A sorting domain-containing protein [Saprospiraceae bacterium]MBK7913440.1 T9SS type A sorting domain-containing protein [Saprospiraceae bacterium]